ncbi:MAG: enoyl-CoA hydratase/isomerase family protein [Pedobacter sp.]|nr:MAG: enoyl-CoA hydratase/isomerase family protein [Pedobacter sp.]
MSEDLVLYSVENRIASITLNRPDKRNALNPELVSELTKALIRSGEDEDVKIVILKANGKSFSAGADLAYLQQLQTNSFDENLADSDRLKKLFTTILYLPKIIIAQVEGHAIAGGCGLATACDIIFAVPEAEFGYTEVKLGFVPAIVSCLLMRKTSETIAKRILFTGELFSSAKALEYNLITFVTEQNQISQTVKDFATDLCANSSGNALMVTKQLINQTTYNQLEASLNEAVHLNAKVRESDDFRNGISSFLKKEKVKW